MAVSSMMNLTPDDTVTRDQEPSYHMRENEIHSAVWLFSMKHDFQKSTEPETFVVELSPLFTMEMFEGHLSTTSITSHTGCVVQIYHRDKPDILMV